MAPQKAQWAVFPILVLAFSCGAPTSTPPPLSGPRTVWRIGLLPEQDIFKQLERYQPVADLLGERVGLDIQLKILPRYGNIIDNFQSSGLDGAFFGSFTYALAHRKIGVLPVARPEGQDGRSTYFGLIFVRKDSGILGIAGMRDKRFAFVDKATTAGYLLPLEYFQKNGVTDFRSFFKEFYFAGTHENAILDVLNGRADIGAAKNTVWSRLAAADPRIEEQLLVLERSPAVPENGLALRPDIDARLRERVKTVLLDMHRDPVGQRVLAGFGAAKFVETRDEDYDPVYQYARECHLDLGSYDYSNE